MLINRIFLIALLGVFLVACSDKNDNEEVTTTIEPPTPSPEYSFEVTVRNLTHGQPLSPIGIALHKGGHFWQVGEMASNELEQLAESGDNSALLGLDIVDASVSDSVSLAPGESTSLNITTNSLEEAHLSLVSMLVNTNDGFSGLNAIDVSALEVGTSLFFKTRAYDSGTEENSEAVGTIPGPADMGEGFNSLRNDIDLVVSHPGVVSQDDGLTHSVLTHEHKFDNPLMAISITRIQ